MKLTKSKLKQIIKEELRKVLKEQTLPHWTDVKDGKWKPKDCEEARAYFEHQAPKVYDEEDTHGFESDLIEFMESNKNCFQAELGKLKSDENPIYDQAMKANQKV